MKDSILKGTGNSRFLKSAIPEGTTWAEALAMLRAGTFPMDLNGINSAGFQQVGTPLNKANLLKDVNALTLGLTGDAVPNDMFNILAHAGDLHVWKKQVRDASVSAPGYNLGGTKSSTDICQAPSGHTGYFGVKAEYSNEVTVNNSGDISLVSPTEINLEFAGSTATFFPKDAANTLKNKFLKIVSVLTEQPDATILDSYKGAVIRCESNFSCGGYGNSSPGYIIYFSGFRPVTPYPAGFSVTYPVSTNRNAYPDVKPAGYTLGSVVKGTFNLVSADHMGSSVSFYRADAVSITSDGSMGRIAVSPNPYTTVQGYDALPSEFKGKFIQVLEVQARYAGSPFKDDRIYYIPEDAVFSTNSVDRYQPVNSYPEDDTYQYLGQLGGSFRCAVVSYIGTGVYGAANPITITAPFRIRAMIMLYSGAYYTNTSNLMVNAADLSTEYVNYAAFYGNGAYSSQTYGASTFGKISKDGRSYSWYNTQTAEDYVFNAEGVKYSILVIG